MPDGIGDFFMFKFKIKVAVKQILYLLSHIIPKKDNLIIFKSFPDFADNARYLWEYIHGLSEMETVWLIADPVICEKLNKQGIRAYEYRFNLQNLRMVWSILRAKYLADTHFHLNEFISKDQVFIALSHGTPLKAVHYADIHYVECDRKFKRRKITAFKYLTVTSDVSKYAQSAAFAVSPQKCVVTGQPRNDRLFGPKAQAELETILDVKLGDYKKIILYTPTFRVGNDDRTEGGELSQSNNIFRLNNYSNKQMQEFLQEKNCLVVAKLHPFEEKHYVNFKVHEEFALPDNVKILKTADLNNGMYTLYDFMNLFDALMTDYSSIYFDFLLLDRPIVFLLSDFNLYHKQRGLFFEDYEFWMPGPKVNNFHELLESLHDIFVHDNFKEQRKIVNRLMNKYNDGNSSERIYSLMKKGHL